ncbi:MAG: polysaccharide deacetylase family protein [Pirellulales bacterium]
MNRPLTNLKLRLLSLAAIALVQATLPGWSRAGSLIATWQNNATAAISLTHDDNRRDFINVAAPALASRGLTGSFNVNPGTWPNTSWATSFAKIAQQGNELVDHTMFHKAARIVPADQDPTNKYFHSLDEFKQDILNATAVLNPLQLGGRPTMSFCYPFGQSEAATKDILRQYFLSARVSTRFLINSASPSDMYYLTAVYVGNPTGYNDPWSDPTWAYNRLTEYTNAAVVKGGWAIEEYHDILDPGYASLNDQAYYRHLDDLAAAQQASRLWVAPQGDVTRYIYSRNAATVMPISADASLIRLTVNDSLPDDLFDVPLTIKTEIPASWGPDISVLHGGEGVASRFLTESGLNYVQYSIVPNGRLVEIAPSAHTPPPPLAGDVDLNGSVDIFDVAVLQQSFGQSGKTWADGDFNNDGIVDIFDVVLLQRNYGAVAPPAAAPAAVPEPSSFALAALALAGGVVLAVARRRSRPE